MIYDIFSDKNKAYRHDEKLSKAITDINSQLESTYNCFNEATDPLIIEALIYRIKELELEYSFLVKRAKLERLCGDLVPNGVSQ